MVLPLIYSSESNISKEVSRIALGLEYDGSAWEGWQSQPSGKTIQQSLEFALEKIVGHPVRAHCAGRTDAGVHATHQVVHFDTPAIRPLSAWTRGVNTYLPKSIAVHWAKVVPESFHARFSATGRRYRYILLNRPQRPGLLNRKVGWFHRPLEIDAMREAATYLLGEHDFSSFRSIQCQSKTPVKTLHLLAIQRSGDFYSFDFAANAFLHHMIRNIVGALIEVGSGKRSKSWMQEILNKRDRQSAAPTFDAAGLYFMGPAYPPHWGLPGLTQENFLRDNPPSEPNFLITPFNS